MSYKEGCHPFLQYTEEEKQEIRKELGIKESSIEDDIDAITEWFEKQAHLVEAGTPERYFIERMLIFAKGSREKTKQRIDNFYKYRSLAPEIIQNRENYNMDSFWRYYGQASIPKLYELKRVTILQFWDPDPNHLLFDVIMRASIMLGDLRLKYDYCLGDIWILDVKNVTYGHVLRINPVIAQKAAQIFQDGLGIRVHAIHFLGAPSLVKHIINFFKLFVKPKIMDRVMFHDNLKELQKFVPKKYLPKDYGGDEWTLDECKETYFTVLRDAETKQYLAECTKQISNESKRSRACIHEEYLAGSFKKLDLD